jgi:NitT/TauT family transport system substrate-binding protein
MKNNVLRFLPATLTVILMLALLLCLEPLSANAATAPWPKPELTEFKMGLPANDANFLPSWAAEQRGFFKEEGFTDFKILVFQGDAPTVQALAAGTVDLVVASLTGLVNSITAGQRFKAVWGGYNMAHFEWYGLPKYKSIAELKGGRLGISRFGSMTDFLTRYALRKAGINPEKDVTLLALGGSAQFLAALAAGQLDASILSIPNTYTAVERGYVRLATQRDLVSPDYPTHIVFSKEEFIAKNPNTIKAYLRATSRAMEWIKANPDEAAKLVNKQMKFDVDHARKGINDVAYGWAPDGRLPQEAGMKVFWSIAVDAGDVKEPWPTSRWLDDSFLKTQGEWRK